MPLVNIHMAEGRSPESKARLMAAITDAMHEHIGAPRESVRVWIAEFPATDFMAGGELLADKQARLAAERAEAGTTASAASSASASGNSQNSANSQNGEDSANGEDSENG